MSTASFTIKVANPDKEDRRTFKRVVDEANRQITKENAGITLHNSNRSQSEQLPSKPLWPASTQAEYVDSFEKIWVATRLFPQFRDAIQQTNESLQQEIAADKELFESYADANPAQRANARAALKS